MLRGSNGIIDFTDSIDSIYSIDCIKSIDRNDKEPQLLGLTDCTRAR